MNTWRLSVVLSVWLWPVPSVVALAQTQAAVNQDACGGYAKADGEMNEIYRRVLHEYAADAQFLRKMRAAQRAWVTYRDAHLAALYPAADSQAQYGSAYPMCRCTALAEVTRKRAEELRRWADGTAEGDVCAGSVRVRTAAGAAQTGGEASLFGKRWTLAAMGERSFSAGEPYLTFDREPQRVSGSSGCNRLSGGFRVDGANLKFTPLAVTNRACIGEEAQQVETSFLKALEQTTGYRIQGDVLSLYTNDSPVLTFKAGAADAGGATETASVTGTVTYRQRIALTPRAVVEVKLLDVSRADAPATTIAEQVIKPAGRQVPIKFELRYDPRRIEQRLRYVVRVRILEDGKLRFTGTHAYPVITGGNPTTFEVVVEPVG